MARKSSSEMKEEVDRHGNKMVECSEHGKKRSENNMIRDGKGGYCCMPGFDCKMDPEGGGSVCSVHNKKRSSICLEPDGFGGFKCKEEFLCKGYSVPKAVKESWANMPVPESGGIWITAKEGDWDCPACNELQFQKNDACQKCKTPKPPEANLPGAFPNAAGTWVSAKPGDWDCPGCGNLQFARNETCRKCRTPRPNGANVKHQEWSCPGCGDHQFARNLSCRKCGTARPESAGAGPLEETQTWSGTKPGDWNCPGCGDLQFARNEACRQCYTPRPENVAQAFAPAPQRNGTWISGISAKPGDWNCPSCGDLIFGRQQQCRKCLCERPPEALAAAIAVHQQQDAIALQTANQAGPGSQQQALYGAQHEEALMLAQQEAFQAAYLQGLMQGNLLGSMQAAAAVEEKAAEEPPAKVAKTTTPAPAAVAPVQETWKCPGCGNVQFCKMEKCARCRRPQPGTPAALEAERAAAISSSSSGGGDSLSSYAQSLGINVDQAPAAVLKSGRASKWN